MGKYCGKCGTQMEQTHKFCAACGTMFESNLITPENTGKNLLTNAVIQKDLHSQKHSVWEFLGQLLLLGLMFLVAYLGSPAIFICGIFWVLNVINMIRHNVKRSRKKYYVLERDCIKKEFVEKDEDPDVWKLWFVNRNGELYVSLEVSRDFYDETQIGEGFYVVFLENDRTPSLCYRKTQWAM